MPGDIVRFPALTRTQCAIRRKINFCEFYNDCGFRVNLESKKPCSVDLNTPRQETVFDYLDLIDQQLDHIAAGHPHDCDRCNTAKNYVNQIRQKLINAVSEIGI